MGKKKKKYHNQLEKHFNSHLELRYSEKKSNRKIRRVMVQIMKNPLKRNKIGLKMVI
jgi:hypothetical protein